MEEQKSTAGKGAEWGAIIDLSQLQAEMETQFRLIAQP